MRVLLTGITGFVGGFLAGRLLEEGHEVVALVRAVPKRPLAGVEYLRFDTLTSLDHIAFQEKRPDVFIHCAARVHVMNETAEDPFSEFYHVNRDGAVCLAKKAVHCGARRFIFLSTIKVNGEKTEPGNPFRAGDEVMPAGPYARSKFEAEKEIASVFAGSDTEYVIIRPPLVYGPGVRANFLKMIRWMQRGVPLPLGGMRNRRSLVGIRNLVDLIALCLESDSAANSTFLVSDGEAVSTSCLLTMVASALGRKSRLFPVPVALLRLTGLITRKSDVIDRLVDSLEVDFSETHKKLDWLPPYSMQEEIDFTVKAFLREKEC